MRRSGCGIYGTWLPRPFPSFLTTSRSQSRAPIQVLEDARDAVQALHVDATTIIAGSVDGYVRTYDLRKGELRADFVGRTVSSSPSLCAFTLSLSHRSCHLGRPICRRHDAPGCHPRLEREAVRHGDGEALECVYGARTHILSVSRLFWAGRSECRVW